MRRRGVPDSLREWALSRTEHLDHVLVYDCHWPAVPPIGFGEVPPLPEMHAIGREKVGLNTIFKGERLLTARLNWVPVDRPREGVGAHRGERLLMATWSGG